MNAPSFVRVQLWVNAEDGSEIELDVRGRLREGDDLVLENSIPTFAEMEAGARVNEGTVELRAHREHWDFQGSRVRLPFGFYIGRGRETPKESE